jgi:hypothetical protein
MLAMDGFIHQFIGPVQSHYVLWSNTGAGSNKYTIYGGMERKIIIQIECLPWEVSFTLAIL